MEGTKAEGDIAIDEAIPVAGIPIAGVPDGVEDGYCDCCKVCIVLCILSIIPSLPFNTCSTLITASLKAAICI